MQNLKLIKMKTTVKVIYPILFLILLLASCQDHINEPSDSEKLRFEELNELFTDYEIVTLPNQALLQHSLENKSQEFAIDLEIDEKPSWVFNVNYHEFYDTDYKTFESDENGGWIEVQRDYRSDAYHGQSVDKKSRAMFIMEDEFLTGSIYDGDIEYFLEPLNRFVASASAEQYVYYRIDADINGQSIMCGNDDSDSFSIEENTDEATGGETSLSTRATCRDMTVTYVADYEYRGKFGNNTNSTRIHIENRLRYGSYRYWGYNQYPLYFRLWRSYIRTNTSNRPATSSNSSTFLSQFRSWSRAGNIGHGDSNLIYTGRNFGSLYGKAYVGVVCKYTSSGQRRAYGMITKIDNVSNGTYNKVTAHEVGHNLSCSHQSTGFMKQGNHSNSSMATATKNQLNSYISSNSSCMPNRTCVWYD